MSSEQTHDRHLRNRIKYFYPINNSFFHIFTCLSIIIVMSVIMFNFFRFSFGGMDKTSAILLSSIGGLFGIFPLISGNMPSTTVIKGNKSYILRYLQNIIDSYMVGERRSGFCFGYSTKQLSENKHIIIPKYNPLLPKYFKFFEDGSGFLFKFFGVQTCFFIEVTKDGAVVSGPYRSLKILNSFVD